MTDITRRGFLASGAIATGFGLSAHALESADITWVSDDPYLGGNFAPVGRELDAADLPVIAGRIPPDLSGAYMRNGPNPLFKPISFTYPMDGDGMIHAVYLDNGRARYRNRFVADHEPRGRAARRPRGLWRPRAHRAGRSARWCGQGEKSGPGEERRLHQRAAPWRPSARARRGLARLRADDGARHARRVEGRHRQADPARRAQPAPSAVGRAVRARLQRQRAGGRIPPHRCVRPAGGAAFRWRWRRRR